MLSPFLVYSPKTPYTIPSPSSPTHSLQVLGHGIPLHIGHRAFIGHRVSTPIDDWLGHPLLQMQLEPWVLPRVLFGWWFRFWDFWMYWLVHIVVPSMGLQTPSAPLALFLAPSLGTLCLVQWMAVNIHLCICQALVEPLRRQLYQASVSKHLLASTIVSGATDQPHSFPLNPWEIRVPDRWAWSWQQNRWQTDKNTR